MHCLKGKPFSRWVIRPVLPFTLPTLLDQQWRNKRMKLSREKHLFPVGWLAHLRLELKDYLYNVSKKKKRLYFWSCNHDGRCEKKKNFSQGCRNTLTPWPRLTASYHGITFRHLAENCNPVELLTRKVNKGCFFLKSWICPKVHWLPLPPYQKNKIKISACFLPPPFPKEPIYYMHLPLLQTWELF